MVLLNAHELATEVVPVIGNCGPASNLASTFTAPTSSPSYASTGSKMSRIIYPLPASR